MGDKTTSIISAIVLRRQFSFVLQVEVTVNEDKVEFFGMTYFSCSTGHSVIYTSFYLVQRDASIF